MKPTFAYIQNQRIPNQFAHSIYVVKVCEAAQKLGYKSHLLIPAKKQPRHFARRNIWDYYGIKKDFFKVVKFKVPQIEKQPFALEVFLRHLRHQLVTWAFALKAVFYLIKEKIEIVETIDREVIFLLRLIFWYRPQVIYDVHIGPQTWYEKLFDHLAMPKIDLFIANCQFFKNYYQKKGINQNKIIVLPNGFDPLDYRSLPNKKGARKKLRLPLDKFIIGYTGRFENIGGERCVPQMLKAACKLKNTIPVCILALGGPEKLVLKYRRMAEKLGFASNEAIIRSQVRPSKVPLYLAALDTACMLYPKTKHYLYKMSPLKAGEYMAAQRPIIASDLPSIRQLVNEKSAYLVDSDNQKELEQAIIKIWENPKKARQKTQKAYQFIKNFTWQKRQKKVFKSLP